MGRLRTTDVAGFGPVFSIVAVIVRGCPATTVGGLAARTTARFTEGATDAEAVA